MVRRDHRREPGLLHREPRERASSVSRPARSSPAPGSSRSSSCGRETSARAISVRVRSPCEQSAKRCAAIGVTPNVAPRASARARSSVGDALLEEPDRARGAGSHDLLDRERRREAAPEPRVDEADLLAQPEDVGAAEPLAEHARPCPCSGTRPRPTSVRSVVLPAPFGPSSAQRSPVRAAHVTPSMIGRRRRGARIPAPQRDGRESESGCRHRENVTCARTVASVRLPRYES